MFSLKLWFCVESWRDFIYAVFRDDPMHSEGENVRVDFVQSPCYTLWHFAVLSPVWSAEWLITDNDWLFPSHHIGYTVCGRCRKLFVNACWSYVSEWRFIFFPPVIIVSASVLVGSGLIAYVDALPFEAGLKPVWNTVNLGKQFKPWISKQKF